VRVVVVVLVAVVLVVRSASSSSSSSSSSFMGRGLGLKPNLTYDPLRPEHSPTYPHVLYTFAGPNRRNPPTPTY